MALINLAIEENKDNTEYIALLEKAKKHFYLYKGFQMMKTGETE